MIRTGAAKARDERRCLERSTRCKPASRSAAPSAMAGRRPHRAPASASSEGRPMAWTGKPSSACSNAGPRWPCPAPGGPHSRSRGHCTRLCCDGPAPAGCRQGDGQRSGSLDAVSQHRHSACCMLVLSCTAGGPGPRWGLALPCAPAPWAARPPAPVIMGPGPPPPGLPGLPIAMQAAAGGNSCSSDARHDSS